MIEIEVQVVYGSWLPSETFIEKFERVANKAHTHENFGALADFSTDENGNLLYKGKPVSNDRPTATVEAIGELASAARTDMTSFEALAIGAYVVDYLYDKVPLGAEIKTIEFRLEEQDDWIDIHRMHEYDGIPCVINMTYVSDGTQHGVYDKLFALITPAVYSATNFLYDAISGNTNGDIRITYYTDNIGGENNA